MRALRTALVGGANGGRLRNIRPKFPATVTSGGHSRCCVPSPNTDGMTINTVSAMSTSAITNDRFDIFLNLDSEFIFFLSGYGVEKFSVIGYIRPAGSSAS